MSTKIIGKLDNWDDGDTGGSDYLDLQEGGNPVRIITSPHQFYSHWTVDESNMKRKVRCAMENCPVCQRGERAVARWYVGVISRKTNKCAILEIGPQIYKQIKSLAGKKDKWGDPRRYDLDIVRQPKGSQPLYLTSPEPPTPVTDEEKAMVKEFLARVDLVKMTEAPQPEAVMEKLGLPPSPKAAKVNNDFSVADEATTAADDDFDFGD